MQISIITLGVSDLERSLQFYRDGLGFPTTKSVEDGIIFFKTGGVCLALYPYDKLVEDYNPGSGPVPERSGGFSGITLAHNTREKSEVEKILDRAEKAGGRIVKPAQDVFWGGFSGYFAERDGYLWEVAYADSWEFNEDGSLVID